MHTYKDTYNIPYICMMIHLSSRRVDAGNIQHTTCLTNYIHAYMPTVYKDTHNTQYINTYIHTHTYTHVHTHTTHSNFISPTSSHSLSILHTFSTYTLAHPSTPPPLPPYQYILSSSPPPPSPPLSIHPLIYSPPPPPSSPSSLRSTQRV